jgi:hypothetical protein
MAHASTYCLVYSIQNIMAVQYRISSPKYVSMLCFHEEKVIVFLFLVILVGHKNITCERREYWTALRALTRSL